METAVICALTQAFLSLWLQQKPHFMSKLIPFPTSHRNSGWQMATIVCGGFHGAPLSYMYYPLAASKRIKNLKPCDDPKFFHMSVG